MEIRFGEMSSNLWIERRVLERSLWDEGWLEEVERSGIGEIDS